MPENSNQQRAQSDAEVRGGDKVAEANRAAAAAPEPEGVPVGTRVRSTNAEQEKARKKAEKEGGPQLSAIARLAQGEPSRAVVNPRLGARTVVLPDHFGDGVREIHGETRLTDAQLKWLDDTGQNRNRDGLRILGREGDF